MRAVSDVVASDVVAGGGLTHSRSLDVVRNSARNSARNSSQSSRAPFDAVDEQEAKKLDHFDPSIRRSIAALTEPVPAPTESVVAPTESADRVVWWPRRMTEIRKGKDKAAYDKFIGWGEFKKRLQKHERVRIIHEAYGRATDSINRWKSYIDSKRWKAYKDLCDETDKLRQAALDGPDQAARALRDTLVPEPDQETRDFRARNEKYEFEGLYRQHVEKIMRINQQVLHVRIIDAAYGRATNSINRWKSYIDSERWKEYKNLCDETDKLRRAALDGPDQAARALRDTLVPEPDQETRDFRARNEKYEFEGLYRRHVEKIMGINQQVSIHAFNEGRDKMERYFQNFEPSDKWFATSSEADPSMSYSKVGGMREDEFIARVDQLKREAQEAIQKIEHVDTTGEITEDQKEQWKKCKMEYEDKFQYVQIAYKIEGEFKKGTKRLKELRGEIASLHCDQSTKTRLQEKYEGLLKMTQNRIDYTDPLNPSQVQNLNRSFAGFNKQLQEIDFDHGLDATVYDNTFWEIALQTKKQEIKHIFPGDNADNLIRSICDRYGVPAPSDEPVSDEPVLDTLASDRKRVYRALEEATQ